VRFILKPFIIIYLFALMCGLTLPLLSQTALAASPNLITNPTMQTVDPTNSAAPEDWSSGGWGTNKPTYSYLATGYNGDKSLEVNMSSYTSGDAKWYFAPVTVTGSTEYTFSDYYESNVATEVVAQLEDASGNLTYQDLGSAQAASSWQNEQVAFTTPSTTTSITIFHLIESVGTLTTSDFSLTSGNNVTPPPVATGNIVPNPTVATASSTNSAEPASWTNGGWGTNTPKYSYLSTGYNGDKSLEVNMTSYTSGDAKWYFNPVAAQANTQYQYSDYYESNVATEVVAQYEDTSGNYTYVTLGTTPASTTWKQYTDTFTTPSSLANVTIYHVIQSVGTLTTSDFSLMTSTAPSASITAPTSASTVTGTINLTAQASAADGVTSVQFQIDGANVGSPVTASPYQLSWNSTTVANGTHTVDAVVTGKDGTKTTSAAVSFEVSNAATLSGNMIPNPLVTTVNPTTPTQPQDWTPSNWGTNTPKYSYLSTGYDDTRSLEITMSKYSSGDAKWYFTPQVVKQDTQYNFSEYYEATVQTEVEAVFTMSDGSIVYQIIGQPNAATTWTKFSTDFSIPLGAQNVTIYHLIQKNGTLITDDFSMKPYTPVGFSRPLLTLTFDDGYSSTFDYGLPLLQQYGYASTQFIITDLIGQTGYMTQANVKTLYTDGQEVASHTVTHTDLTSETAAQVTTELSQSQQSLVSWTGAPVTDFAYPYGLYNSSVMTSVEKYYSAARGVEDALNSKDNFNAYDIRVQNLFNTTTPAQVADWVAQAQATNTWLVLVYHSVDPDTTSPIDGDTYNTTPTQLSAELAGIKSSGITVESMKTALAEVESQL